MFIKILIFLLVIINIFSIYIFVIEPHNIEIRNIQYPLSPSDATLEGLRIIHISDLHIGSLGPYEKYVVRTINKQSADFICITGDLIMYNKDFRHAIRFINQLKAKDSIFIVFGNSDYSHMHSFFAATKEKPFNSNVFILRNEIADASFNGTPLLFVGLDDPITGHARYKSFPFFSTIDRFVLLLSHAYTQKISEISYGVDLALAGHTHGGQVNILPRDVIERWRNDSPENVSIFFDGFHRDGNTWVNISRGIGTSYLPIRFRSRPDICVFDFVFNGDA